MPKSPLRLFPAHPSACTAVILFSFSLLVFLLTSSEPQIYYRTEPAVHRFFVTQSLVENFEFTVPESLGIQGEEGKSYSWWGFGATFLTAPLYVAGKVLQISPVLTVTLGNPLITAATVVLIYLFAAALGCSRKPAIGAALLYGFATFAWPSAKHPFEHPFETFFVLLTFYLIFRFTLKERWLFLFNAGLALGMAFLTRPTALLALVGTVPMLLYGSRACGRSMLGRVMARFGFILAGFLPFGCLYALYNYHRFGSFFETGYGLIAQRLGLNFFFGSSFLQGLSGLFLSPGKGFFFYSPITILALLTWKPLANRHPQLFRGILLFGAAHLFLIANNFFWHGDWAWGPRYLLVLTPFPVLVLACFFESCSPMKKWHSGIIWGLLAGSVLLQIAAISINFERYFHYLSKDAGIQFIVLNGAGAQPIVEPPFEVYFRPDLSHILLQTKFIKMAFREGCDSPPLGRFDFWWHSALCPNLPDKSSD